MIETLIDVLSVTFLITLILLMSGLSVLFVGMVCKVIMEGWSR